MLENSKTSVKTRRITGRAKFLFLLIFMAACSTALAQQNVYYRSSDNKIIRAAQLDSLIDAKGKKLKPLGFQLQKVVSNKRISGDSVIYDFSLKAGTIGAIDNNNKYSRFIGKPLPEFSSRDLNGREIKSGRLLGKPMIINMWFTTCIPCINEMSQLNKIRHSKQNSGVTFIAITFENKKKVLHFLKKHQFDFTQLTDQKAYCEQFTDNYPISIFVNKHGIIEDIQDGMPMIYDKRRKVFSNLVDPESFNSALKKIKNGI